MESLDGIEIVFAIEERFGIEVPFNANSSDSFNMRTIGDAIRSTLWSPGPFGSYQLVWLGGLNGVAMLDRSAMGFLEKRAGIGRIDKMRSIGKSWCRNSVGETVFFNALSISFPHAERFFVNSVRTVLPMVKDNLLERSQIFINQENQHASAHHEFNKKIADHGYDVEQLAKITRLALIAGRLGDIRQKIGMTMAMEHLTTIISSNLIQRDYFSRDVEIHIRSFWMWHMKEELEHKDLAFDLFLFLTKSLSDFSIWALRARMMILATKIMVRIVVNSMNSMLLSDGYNRRWRRWSIIGKTLVLYPGFYTRVILQYFSFYLPRFHPSGRIREEICNL